LNAAPILTIITVTAFDLARLKRTLKSISGSTAQIEHVFVLPENDQESLNLVRDYASINQFSVKWIHDHKEGIYPAMNLGAESALGHYLLYLNSGDEILNQVQFALNLNSLAEARPVWAILGVDLPWNSEYHAYSGMERSFRWQQKNGYVSHQSVIVRRDAFLSLGRFSAVFPIAADTLCIFKFADMSSPFLLDGISVKVEEGNNVTSHNRESRLEVLKIINLTGTVLDRTVSNYNFLKRELTFVLRKLQRLLTST
jgi:hypothetical protein